MRSREFYEEELEALKSIDSSPEGIRDVEEQIQALEDKQAQAKLDKLEGIRGTGLNNQEKHQLKELKAILERQEQAQVDPQTKTADPATKDSDELGG